MRDVSSCERLIWNNTYTPDSEETVWYVAGIKRLLERLDGTAITVERAL
jgi:hypothetical protein